MGWQVSWQLPTTLPAPKRIWCHRCSLALGAPPPRAIHHHELLARSATQHARSAPGLRRSDLGHGAELLCGGKPVAPSCRVAGGGECVGRWRCGVAWQVFCLGKTKRKSLSRASPILLAFIHVIHVQAFSRTPLQHLAHRKMTHQ